MKEFVRHNSKEVSEEMKECVRQNSAEVKK